ncbi:MULTISPECIES: hypothetical protein [Methylobacteriaceae]|jgi:hypothetical protein|uniref:Nicotinate-nucleotide/dimethylbenzimidazole phosphoribosyltransferase n=2 Tax=Methylobacteriaceae TaxID=119045 RepID=A0A161JK41_9HYPH|nr:MULTISPECIES: hypothetical protein [Methylobacteriaceae]MBX9876017.1 hypothetical protein [Beijerinckiaceae bacterium]MDV2984053.1 hypothetical protein [Methylobacteriaceae bacterium AG10]RUP04289.1 MAG: hypothetical protein EKK34_14770 [Mycobacterium sp.]BAU89027.1 nicotinate-nucleotide/dimethylbenzimidazole phosphoribosyltransferase [Methylorubrum populi]GJE28736.1 hypothetical protein LKMONMHP_3610 [Methylobacterium organophilum]
MKKHLALAAVVLLAATGAQAQQSQQKIAVKNRDMIVAITSEQLEDKIVGKPEIFQRRNIAYAIGMTRSLHRACTILSAEDSARLERLERAYRTRKASNEIDAAMQAMVLGELDNGASDTAALLGRYDCAALERAKLTGPLLAFWNKYLPRLAG